MPQPPPSDLQSRRLGDVVFTCPADWLLEPVPGIEGVIAMHPRVERDWRANVLVELAPEAPGRTIARALDLLCESLVETQRGLHLRRREVVRRPSGGLLASVEYDALHDDGLALTQWDVVWEAEPGRMLHVTASSVCALWPRYAPVFESVVASICSPNEVVGATVAPTLRR